MSILSVSANVIILRFTTVRYLLSASRLVVFVCMCGNAASIDLSCVVSAWVWVVLVVSRRDTTQAQRVDAVVDTVVVVVTVVLFVAVMRRTIGRISLCQIQT